VTQNDTLGDIADAAVLVKGNVIAWAGPMAGLPEEAAAADATVSLPGCVVIPGLVNTHHHMYQTLTRCIAQVRHPSYCLKCTTAQPLVLAGVLLL